MNVLFINTGNSYDISSNIEKYQLKDIGKKVIISSEKIKNDNNQKQSEVEQLQTNILNSLNYASNQKLLPSTLPEQLNIKFLNVSKLDKLKDRIIPSPIAQLESPNTILHYQVQKK